MEHIGVNSLWPVSGLAHDGQATRPGGVARRFLRQPIPAICLGIVAVWVAIALLAPHLPVADPNQVEILDALEAPSSAHWFGTDEVGRDVLSRVLFAARVSLPASLIIVVAAVIVGSIVGAIAGRFGGYVDQVLMRICDAVMSFPSIILAMAIATIRGGPGLENVVIAVVLVLWPEYARLMRAEILSLKQRDYVLAARASGANGTRIFTRHLLPNASAPIIVKSTLDVGAAILFTASLSFLGFGAVPPTAEWGAMVSQGAAAGLQFWWASAFPAMAIVSVVTALNFFGDGLRDAMDPHH